MKTAIYALTRGGRKLAEKIAGGLPAAEIMPVNGISSTLAADWHRFDGFICIMACGIVVRAIAPLLADKYVDPAVVVLDEKGKNVISLLAGHLGGANELAEQLATVTGGRAVITTASDTLGLVPLDIWAREQHLAVSRRNLRQAAALFVSQGKLAVFSDIKISFLPPGLSRVTTVGEADIIISNKNKFTDKPVFYPQNLVIGVGCNRGTPKSEFCSALAELLAAGSLAAKAIRNLATIDKKNDEPGLQAFAALHKWPLEFFNRAEINRLDGIKISAAALKAVGVIGVAEPCALLSARTDKLLIRKRKWQNITMAVAQAPFTLSAPGRAPLNI